MQKYKKPTFTVSQLGVNPCISSLKIPVVKKVFDKQYKRDEEGDLLPVEQEVEYTEFTKFYNSPERRKVRNALSTKAKSLLFWIMDELEAGADHIWINKQRYMEELSISSIDTYKNGITELIRYALIVPTIIKDVYWINPDFMFKGDRIKKYPKNVVKYK